MKNRKLKKVEMKLDKEDDMREEKIVVEMNSFEQRLLVGGLMEFKNILEKQKAPTEDVADLILKVIDAPKKRRKSISRESR